MSRCRCPEYQGGRLETARCTKHDPERFEYKFVIPSAYVDRCSTTAGPWAGVCFDCHMRLAHLRQWREGIGYGQRVDCLLDAGGEADTS
jgi:hypothetical protein